MPRVNHLQELIRRGHLKSGAVLYHAARRHAERGVEGTVEANGLRVRDKLYPSLSSAARAVAGHAVNGWKFWRIQGSGQTLDALRREARE
jgi:hypothetical protein